MWRSLLSGVSGAVALNVVHETARHLVSTAPRVDQVGKRAVDRAAHALGRSAPAEPTRYGLALAGDLVSNALYFGLVGAGRRRSAWRRGLGLGLAAGVGAVVLTPALGLGARPVRRTPATASMTVGWYTLGGLVAAAVYRSLDRR